jgi:hypothetical protein
MGHNIPEPKGGGTTINNLFPVCAKCKGEYGLCVCGVVCLCFFFPKEARATAKAKAQARSPAKVKAKARSSAKAKMHRLR